MCAVFLTSNQAEHIKVLTTALYAPLRLTEKERKAERETVSSTAHSLGQCVWIPHSGSYLTQYDLTPSYTHTHLNKWANAKEWDTVRKGDKTFYPQCWTSHNAVLSFISSPVLSVLFHLIGVFFFFFCWGWQTEIHNTICFSMENGLKLTMVSQNTVIHLSELLWCECTTTYWMNDTLQGIAAFLTELLDFSGHHVGTQFWAQKFLSQSSEQ